MPGRLPIELLRGSATPAFLTAGFRVEAVNPAAEMLLGRRGADLRGAPCEEVVCGRDVFGNVFCHDRCAIRQTVAAGEDVRDFRLFFAGAAAGFHAWLTILQFSAEEERCPRLLHLFQPLAAAAAAPRGAAARPRDLAAVRAAVFQLTRRERDVLAGLVAGRATEDLARELFMSPTTTRNHVQSILRKLSARNRAEAITTAVRHRLVDPAPHPHVRGSSGE